MLVDRHVIGVLVAGATQRVSPEQSYARAELCNDVVADLVLKAVRSVGLHQRAHHHDVAWLSVASDTSVALKALLQT